MGISGAMHSTNADAAPLPSNPQEEPLAYYRTQIPQQSRKVLRFSIEIPVPRIESLAFALPIMALHAAIIWLVANTSPHAFARIIAPLAVHFLPPQTREPPPEPPLLPAAALQFEVDPLKQVLPPSVAIDAFESESRAITTQFLAPQKAIPGPVIAEIEDEGEGTFVRPRPIRGRSGKQAYPSGAAAAGESGRATVKICITARGAVESVEIIESTGFARLDNDALDIAREYRFRPATRNGKAVPVCLPYSINYRIR